MGMIRIDIRGSFHRCGTQSFSAMKHGHARCITDAIAALVELLPGATKLDHELHSQGHLPDGPFGCGDGED